MEWVENPWERIREHSQVHPMTATMASTVTPQPLGWHPSLAITGAAKSLFFENKFKGSVLLKLLEMSK
jgi:hypothetical protein